MRRNFTRKFTSRRSSNRCCASGVLGVGDLLNRRREINHGCIAKHIKRLDRRQHTSEGFSSPTGDPPSDSSPPLQDGDIFAKGPDLKKKTDRILITSDLFVIYKLEKYTILNMIDIFQRKIQY